MLWGALGLLADVLEGCRASTLQSVVQGHALVGLEFSGLGVVKAQKVRLTNRYSGLGVMRAQTVIFTNRYWGLGVMKAQTVRLTNRYSFI